MRPGKMGHECYFTRPDQRVYEKNFDSRARHRINFGIALHITPTLYCEAYI